MVPLPDPHVRGVAGHIARGACGPAKPKGLEDDDASLPGAGAEGECTVAGVRGRYLPGKLVVTNPKAHATALVLGRLMLWTILNNCSQRSYTALVWQLHMAGSPVGQKFHHGGSVNQFAGIAAMLCRSIMHQRFWSKPPNLQHPCCWKLVFDSVTLPDGSTVMVILIVHTTESGELVYSVLGTPTIGTTYEAKHEAKVRPLGFRLAGCAAADCAAAERQSCRSKPQNARADTLADTRARTRALKHSGAHRRKRTRTACACSRTH